MMYCKISKTLFIITGLVISFPTLAHTGHELSDGLHQGVAVIAIALSVGIILAGISYHRKKVSINSKD